MNVDWSFLAGSLLKLGAPILGSLVGGPVGGIVTTVATSVGNALGAEPTPEAIQAAINADPEGAAAKLQQLENDNRDGLLRLQAIVEQARVEQTGLTMRAEVQAGDRFQRWARPANMWAVATTTAGYGLCMVAASVNVVVTKDATALTHLVNLAPALGVALMPAGAVAGVTAWQQTKEFLAGVVQRPPSTIKAKK